MNARHLSPVPRGTPSANVHEAVSRQDEAQVGDGKYVALAIAEGCRAILGVLAKRWPEVRPVHKCPNCGWKS